MSMWLDLSVFFTTPISSNLPNSLRVSMSSEVRSSCTLMLSLCQFQDLTRLHHSEQFLAAPSIQITPAKCSEVRLGNPPLSSDLVCLGDKIL